MANNDKDNRATHEKEGVEAAVQPQSSHDDQTPEYRQAIAEVRTNPDAASAANKYKKYEELNVYRAGDGWVTATVTETKSDGAGSWKYKLQDKNGKVIWADQPTWFTEAELDRFGNGEK